MPIVDRLTVDTRRGVERTYAPGCIFFVAGAFVSSAAPTFTARFSNAVAAPIYRNTLRHTEQSV